MAFLTIVRHTLVLGFLSSTVLLASGCKGVKDQPGTAGQKSVDQATDDGSGSEKLGSGTPASSSEALSRSVPAPKPTPNPIVAIEKKLLKEAERAFRESKYTTPTYDNAYDKFHSVLLLNPNNSQARAGLQAILLRYAGLIRSALSEGRVASAERYIAQVEVFYPANSLLMDLKKQTRIARSRQSAQQVVEAEPLDPNAEEIPLSTRELNGKTPTIIGLLSEIALRVRDTDESVMIFARNDREGRWIYGQLKEAAPGYRVRGDIRISRKPKIKILPPL